MSERFELLEQIGRGGMGVVWKARDHDSGEIVALKLLHTMFIDDKDYVARFEREVEVVRRIKSPNVVRVLGYGQREGVPYFAMEYVNGQSLREAIRARGRLPWSDVRAMAADIAIALSGAHDVGIIHRDVKPSNILLGPAGARLADFGIARASDLTRLTGSSTMLGTPHYMAPEGDASPAGDWYALGIVIFEALCGEPPFTGDSMQQVILKHIRQEPDLECVDLAARELVGALLNKEPGVRLEQSRPLIAALVRSATPQVVHERPPRTLSLAMEREFVGKSFVGAPSVTAVSVSPQGSMVAAGFSDGGVRIWGINGGRARQPDRRSAVAITAIEFCFDSGFFTTSDRSGATTVQHLTGTQFASSFGDDRRVAFAHSGKLLAAVGRESQVTLRPVQWAPGANQTAPVLRDVVAAASGRRPAFSPSDQTLAVPQPFGAVAVVDVRTGRATPVPRTPSSGDVLAVGFIDDRTVRWASGPMVWDWPLGAVATPPVLVAVLPTTHQPIDFSAALDVVAYVQLGALNVATLPRRAVGRAEIGMATSTAVLPSVVTALCVSGEGDRVATGHVDGCVRVWRVRYG